MRAGRIALALSLAGCGRFGFAVHSPPDADLLDADLLDAEIDGADDADAALEPEDADATRDGAPEDADAGLPDANLPDAIPPVADGERCDDALDLGALPVVGGYHELRGDIAGFADDLEIGCGSGDGPERVFRFDPAVDAPVTGGQSRFQVVLEDATGYNVFIGSGCLSSGYSCGVASGLSSVTGTLLEGEQLYVVLDAWDPSATFTLRARGIPADGVCTAPFLFPVPTLGPDERYHSHVDVDLAGANNDTAPPCGNPIGDDIIYEVTSPVTGWLDARSSERGAAGGVFSIRDTCMALDAECAQSALEETVALRVEAGRSAYLIADREPMTSGPSGYDVTIVPDPVRGTCAAPIDFAAEARVVSANELQFVHYPAELSFDEQTSTCPGSSGRELVYYVDPDVLGPTMLQVIAGSALSVGVRSTCSDIGTETECFVVPPSEGGSVMLDVTGPYYVVIEETTQPRDTYLIRILH